METCETCRFWIEPIDGTAQCRRNAPHATYGHRYDRLLAAILKVDADYVETDSQTDRMERHIEWPYTGADDWCGDWIARKFDA